jgi:hypothetical protein
VTEVSITCSGLITDDEKRRRVISYGQREIAVGPLEKVVLAWVKDEKGTDAETGDSVTEVKRRVPKLDEDGKPVYETIVTASGSHERWNIKEPICQVRDTYFSTTEPDGSAVGTASAPPNAPSAPANIWTSYDGDMRGNHPNGWVLEARDSEELFPGALWRVSDAWAYYQPELPD